MFWRRGKKPKGKPAPASDKTDAAPPNYDLLKSGGLSRTDMQCTECAQWFIAALDMRVDGNHVIECPYCRHEHCRVVSGGRVTEDRWSSKAQRVDVPPRRVWKSEQHGIATSTASAFIRDRWVNFGNDDE